jgi:hypothetical protein
MVGVKDGSKIWKKYFDSHVLVNIYIYIYKINQELPLQLLKVLTHVYNGT